MSTLLEIEAAAETLPPAQQVELVRFLAARLDASATLVGKARLVKAGGGCAAGSTCGRSTDDCREH